MTDLNKKQAFWAEQLPCFKENYICLAQLEAVEFNNETGNFDALTQDATGFDLEDILEAYHSVNTGWAMWLRAKSQEKAKAQAVPTWISVDDEWPPTDIMVLICWADAPDITPEQDYMTIDEDLNSVWANYQNDPPSHWMHFHSVQNVSGAEQ
ncbi:DUF551 domain-containing protein [Acinetobacter baumannii]|nr:hypothetical protein [Acinetobacter baumannii]EKT9347927.1 hypothetical protein [Acinetobacter baumannii]EKT9979447.1 hypothetical protein [Acinetobacter baumannii]EKU0000864.1 hypothetical protein [Acinetobacter baumannii]EKU0004691.1 hypothetical protein [Acinetobacter baumannii]